MFTPANELFTSEILRWRYARAVVCLVTIQSLIMRPLFCLLRVCFMEGYWNPLVVASHAIHTLHPISLIFALPAPILCFVVLARVHVKSSTVTSWVPKRRVDYLLYFYSLANFVYFFTLIAVSVILALVFSSELDVSSSSILKQCNIGNATCLIRKKLIIFAGVLVGLKFAAWYFWCNGNSLKFSPVHPHKKQLLKSCLHMRFVRDVCTTCGLSHWSFGVWLVLFLVGSQLMIPDTAKNFASIVVFDLPLLSVAMFTVVAVAVTCSLSMHVFQFFVTEPLEFPIEAFAEKGSTQVDENWKLSTALSSDGLLRHLAFYDLRRLAQCPDDFHARRNILYGISRPGGHPVNWVGILTPSLQVVKEFTCRLRQHNCPEDSLPQTKPLAGSVDLHVNIHKSFFTYVTEWWEKMMIVQKVPLFSYFLTEFPDVSNQIILSEAQCVIWAVQALGDLMAASMTEDKYGVVQRNAGDIITALVQLQQILDKMNRGHFLLSQSGSFECSTSVISRLFRSLQLALRSSLYTITDTFKETVKDIMVPFDCQLKLQSYLEFREP